MTTASRKALWLLTRVGLWAAQRWIKGSVRCGITRAPCRYNSRARERHWLLLRKHSASFRLRASATVASRAALNATRQPGLSTEVLGRPALALPVAVDCRVSRTRWRLDQLPWSVPLQSWHALECPVTPKGGRCSTGWRKHRSSRDCYMGEQAWLRAAGAKS